MLLNLILLSIVIISILLLVRQIRNPDIDTYILPICKFNITKPLFEIAENSRVVRYSIISKNKDRFFRDFPIGFKFDAKENFRSKIRITYTISGDDEIELIYDRVVEFELEGATIEHIYYINDIIVGSIDVEIITDSQYGKPEITFEIMQNNICHLDKPQILKIIFPE